MLAIKIFAWLLDRSNAPGSFPQLRSRLPIFSMNHSLIEPLESRIAPASFAISAPSVTEGNSGDQILTFSVTNTSPQQPDITLHFTTGDGTEADPFDNAKAGEDYVATSGDLFFPAGTLSKQFTVTVHGDI